MDTPFVLPYNPSPHQNSYHTKESIYKMVRSASSFCAPENLKKQANKEFHQFISDLPFGAMGEEFISKINRIEHFRFTTKDRWGFYCLLDSYANGNEYEKHGSFSRIEQGLIQIREATEMPHLCTYKISLNCLLKPLLTLRELKYVYLSNDKPLIDLFLRYRLIPPLTAFSVNTYPEILVERQSLRNALVEAFSLKNASCLAKDVVDSVVYFQRRIRGQLRRQNELKRISNRYFNKFANSELRAAIAIAEANTPYKPQRCSAGLSERLSVIASKIVLFTTIKHYTSTSTIANVFDDCLYGRQNLNLAGIKYRAAALGTNDIIDGDANVICFGPFKIDTRCLKNETAKITFNLQKLLEAQKNAANPCQFFKQRDFGFIPTGIQSVTIKKIGLRFRYESYSDYADDVTLAFYKQSTLQKKYHAKVQKYHLISYNIHDIHQILIMNFFRFLDNLKDLNDNDAAMEIDEIYAEIESMNDDELIEFLTVIGKKMALSAEFNFYGAYKIDCEAITKITKYHDSEKKICSFTSEQFLSDDFRRYMPELFQSKRFKEYLGQGKVQELQ